MGKQWKQWLTLFFWAPKSLQVVTSAMKLKDAYSLECTFADQPLEGSLGSRYRAVAATNVSQGNPQATGVLSQNVLSLTQRDSGIERQRPRQDPPDLPQVKTQFTTIILTITSYWHLLYDRCCANAWHVLSHLILIKLMV